MKGPFLNERSEMKVSRAGPWDINIQVGRSLKLRLRCAYILISRTILISWGCSNKVPQTGWLINHRNLLKLWRLGVGDQGAGRVLFWRECFSRLQTASFSYPHGRRAERRSKLLGDSHKGTNPIQESGVPVTSSSSNHFPKAPPPNTIMLEVGI